MGDTTYATHTTDDGIIIRRTEAGGTSWCVPEDEGNRHYQEYLEWLAEGNEPETFEA